MESYNAALKLFSDTADINNLELTFIRILVGFVKDEYELKVQNAHWWNLPAFDVFHLQINHLIITVQKMGMSESGWKVQAHKQNVVVAKALK